MPKEGLKKVLITGASGLLGANIIKNLPENWQTVGVVNKHKININPYLFKRIWQSQNLRIYGIVLNVKNL